MSGFTAKPIRVKGTGAAKLAPGSMVMPKTVVDAIQSTPGTRVNTGIRYGKGLGRAHIPRGGAPLPQFDDGTYQVGSHDTQLNPEEERAFQTWKQRYAPNDSGEDYDLRGAFLAGVTPSANGHWPDTFKKPNHPTFSDESQYATGDAAAQAGHWEGDHFINPTAPQSRNGRPSTAYPRPLPQRADLPQFDVGSFNVQRQGPAEEDPTAGIGQKVKQAIDQSGITSATTPAAAPSPSQPTTSTTSPAAGSSGSGSFLGTGTPSTQQQATLPSSIAAIGGAGGNGDHTPGPGGGPSAQDLTNAALGGPPAAGSGGGGGGGGGQPPLPADVQQGFSRLPGSGGGGTQNGGPGSNNPNAAPGSSTAPLPSSFSASNPPTLTADQQAAAQQRANAISQTAMTQLQNPNYAGAWDGANPNSALGQQVNAALSAINHQRQQAAAGGDWSAATWADLPENLRPPGATLPSFDVGTYGRDPATDTSGTDAVVHEGETILPPDTADAVRSDPSVPASGSVLARGPRTLPDGSVPPQYTGSSSPTTPTSPTTSDLTARATTPAFNPATGGNPTTGGSTTTPTTPTAGGANPLPGGAATLPAFLKNTQDALPNPNQIVARNWLRLDPNTQSLFKAAYENQGYDPSYIDWMVQNLLPGRAGVAPGTTGRILR